MGLVLGCLFSLLPCLHYLQGVKIPGHGQGVEAIDLKTGGYVKSAGGGILHGILFQDYFLATRCLGLELVFDGLLRWKGKKDLRGEGGYFIKLASRGEVRRINGIPREPRNLRSGQPKVESALKDKVD